MAIAGIVAGGKGSRMGNTEKPKQFLELCGKPVIIRTTEAFLRHEHISCVIIGINPDWHEYMDELVSRYFDGNVFVTDGGADRNGTIENILRFAKDKQGFADNEIILTHDAVRPFVSEKMIGDSIEAMKRCEICTTAVPATDTMVISGDGEVVGDFPLRSTVFHVQTPQTFRIGSFLRFYGELSAEEKAAATDACRLFHSKGCPVHLIEGDTNNIKLTYPGDFAVAGAILSDQK